MSIRLIGSTKVEVQLSRKNPTKPLFIVRVTSAKAMGIPGAQLVSQLPVDPADGNVHVKVMLVAGGLAEHQNKAYRDQHDPDEVAKAAGEAFSMLMDQLRRQVPPEKQQAIIELKKGEALRPKPATNFQDIVKKNRR